MNRPRATWLALLAPIPEDARPRRTPVATPGTPGAAPDSPIAGWTNVVFELSDMPLGTRLFMVTLDASGAPIAASDHIYLRDTGTLDEHTALDARLPMRQESLGGRIEADGSFKGTHWTVEGIETDDEQPGWTHTPRAPTDAEVQRLLALVATILG